MESYSMSPFETGFLKTPHNSLKRLQFIACVTSWFLFGSSVGQPFSPAPLLVLFGAVHYQGALRICVEVCVGTSSFLGGKFPGLGGGVATAVSCVRSRHTVQDAQRLHSHSRSERPASRRRPSTGRLSLARLIIVWRCHTVV